MKSNFIDEFTLAVIKTMQSNSFNYESKPIINTNIIPQVHQRTMQTHFENRKIQFSAPKIPSIINQQIHKYKPLIQKQEQKQIQQSPKQIQFQNPAPINQDNSKYPKIFFLLKDPTISTIECPGPGQPIRIVRSGQKQFTKIHLTPEEIKTILEQIAQEARIPIIEGVFKAAVENIVISAVISQNIGSRFVIKKQTPYALLE